ncbi:hypothetical protein BS17DRAFT_877922 [Gyrodon lividus]|nr:hypothetical protein BS17DRAFT_877922 [Gyrodon lividus]
MYARGKEEGLAQTKTKDKLNHRYGTPAHPSTTQDYPESAFKHLSLPQVTSADFLSRLTPKSPLIIVTAFPAPNFHTAPKQTRRIQSPRSQLYSSCTYPYTFRASDKTPIVGCPTPHDMLRASHNLHDDQDDDGDPDVHDHSDDDPNWDEETTLIALLDDHDHPGHDDKTAIVDRLAPAFAAYRQVGNGYIKQTLIPVIQRTKQVHDAIDADIFIRRLQGLALFDEKSRQFEDVARREYDVKSLEALFVNLEDLTKESDTLFQEFKARMDKNVHHLRQCADQLPGDVERLISKLDKKAKHLGAEDHAKAKEKLLRGILEKY